jgi:tetratricopeptide (TPR) repeat protein
VVPDLAGAHPELIGTRANEVVSLAPDLIHMVPIPPKTLTALADRAERTRFYPVARTARLAHGVAELLMDWARIQHPRGAVIALSDLDEADRTDRELVSILLRRCDPGLVRVLVGGFAGGEDADSTMAAALAAHAERVVGPPSPIAPPAGTDLAQLFIDSDGTSTDSASLQAYLDLDPAERARRHIARAETVVASGPPGVALGAIPYHLERGSAPVETLEKALVAAVEECFDRGFYDATLELALRGRELLGPEPSLAYWNLTNKAGACLSYLGRGLESFQYFDEMRRRSISADIHMNTAYNIAMLYTRHLPRHLHDENRALEWANTAIGIADRHPDPHQRVFFGAFMRNARALVELHRADLRGALNLVNEAIAMTDADLGPDEQLLHRSVLLYNRAQILAALGDPEAALLDYDEIIRRDPDYGDYYFERAGTRRVAGRSADALADYAEAIRLSPPFYEAHVNRADLLRELGDEQAALRDLDYVLTVEPDHLDSLVNRADVLIGMGEWERATSDIDHGLTVDPANPNLLTAQGSLLAESGDPLAALASYTAAIDQNPDFVAAWANRAVLRYGMGEIAEALSDLDAALQLSDDAELRMNRAIALQDLGRHREALADFDIAIADVGADDPELLYRRGLSRYETHDLQGARADWSRHLTLVDPEDSPYAQQIEVLLNAQPRTVESVA